MAHLVRNNLLLLVIAIIASCSSSDEAETVKIEEITFDCGRDCNMDEWVRKGVPWNQPNGSTPAWSFFYFRVNGSGEVDSLYHWGTLRSEVIDSIKINIYNTKGHWKIPDTAKPSDHQWFVLPYFDLGQIPCLSGANCTRADSILQWSILELKSGIGKLQRVNTESQTKILSPVTNDNIYIKM
jgi:hypothetical protein